MGEAKRTTSVDIDAPRVVQTVGPEILRSPTVSPQHHRSSEPIREHAVPEHPSFHHSKWPPVYKSKLIEHWVSNYEWPKSPLEVDIMEDFLVQQQTQSLPRTKSTTSLNETTSREIKSRPYTNKNYEVFLESKGIFLDDHKDGITSDSKNFCRRLLEKYSETPSGTRFDDDVFKSTCQRLRKKNEAGVIRIIAEFIVPSAEGAIDRGRISFQHLVESVNESWDSSIPLVWMPQLPQTLPSSQALQLQQFQKFRLSQPQPDYAVGFPRQSFTDDQLKKLAPFVGEIGDRSFFMGTAYMYFPFLTVEVKCGKTALEIADRQNAHSMALSVRGVVKLFRVVKCEKELHQQILSFSISHDHQMVKIYGHYPVIDGDKTSYYCHPIHKFCFTALDGKERWTSYKFMMGLYDDWASSHLKRLCSAIDQLPEINLDVSQQSEILRPSELGFSGSTGHSRGIKGIDVCTVQGSSFTSVLEKESQPSLLDSQVPPSGPTRENEMKSSKAFKLPQKRRK
ncbi:hypothetical protein I7I48_06665 [Histoplasma ohiense]|nr:hypothetical protein I7I48_06665 [Histoplasma ohiense (nom. inval.)]